MENIYDLFNELRINGGALWVEDGALKMLAPRKFQNRETRNLIAANKAEITKVLIDNELHSREKFASSPILADASRLICPLSPAQERLWFIGEYEQGNNAYHIPAAFELDPRVIKEALEFALQRIVQRHHVLRTTIEKRDGITPLQVVLQRELCIEQATIDEQSFAGLITRDLHRPFNLERDYPIRATIYHIKGPKERRVLLINLHHIASDGWSSEIFERELATYYDAFLKGDTGFRLPPLPIQYTDYAAWQRWYVSTKEMAAKLDYWRNNLAGCEPLELPTDVARPAKPDYHGAAFPFLFTRRQSTQLRALAQAYGVTINSILLGIFNILLGKITGQDDIVVGTAAANRQYSQTEGLIGFFVNMQAIRTKLREAENFKEFVLRLHHHQIEAQLHQDVPFERIVHELKVDRDISRHPIFQVLFNVQHFGNLGKENNGSPLSLVPISLHPYYPVERFDMSVLIDDSGENITGIVSYATSLFREARIARIVAAFRDLVSMILEAPDKSYTHLVIGSDPDLKDKFNVSSLYWKKKGKQAPAFHFEPDLPREQGQAYSGKTVVKTLSDAVSGGIEEFCTRNTVTPLCFFLSAFKILLFRLTGAGEIMVGMAHEDTAPAAGLLPLRTSFEADEPVRSAIGKVMAESAESVRHAGDSPEGPSACEIVFNYGGEHLIRGVPAISLSVKKGAAFECYLTYNERNFGALRMERLLEQYALLIGNMIKNADLPLKEINYRSEEERTQLIAGFNDTKTGYPKDKTLVNLFEAQVKRTPDHIALADGDETLSYLQLNSLANRVAAQLRSEYGIKPDDRVGIRMERGMEMIVTMIGILKSGGAYVPVDPAFPKDRIDYILEDSGCTMVLDREKYALLMSATLDLDHSDPVPVNRPGDLAYIIYTSGSTGKPKGAMIEHLNVVRLFFNEKPLYAFDSEDVWTMFHSYCFDFSVWEMYGALFFGGKLVIIQQAAAKDPDQYIDLMVRHGVTILNQTPSAFYNVIRHELRRSDPLLRLRYVILSGEALNPAALKEWSGRYPGTRLINMYGITETTVFVTYKEITCREISEGISNIGVAIPTLATYVLDQHLQPLPVGQTGELYVSGAGLGRGYLNNRELTESRFIANPFASGEEKDNGYARLYKTGDLARWMPDGNLEYLGRNDQQVKIRGFRIELGEIEHALMQIAGIRQGCVVAKERAGSADRTKYLVGYYICDQPSTILPAEEVLRQISRTLPDYMIPAALVRLTTFPVTVNGKLDKERLPDPSFTDADEYLAPVTEREVQVCHIWQELLGVERVGMTDNFFRIGGNSILAIHVSHRMGQELGCEVKVADIFTYQTPAVLLEAIDPQTQVSIPVTGADRVLLSFAQERLWFIEQYEKGTNAYHIPVLFEIQPGTNTEVLKQAVRKVVLRHEALRSTIEATEEQQNVQVVHEEAPEIGEFRFSHDHDLQNALATNINTPFDLGSSYPFRAGIYRLAGEGVSPKEMLLITIHHIASDGWSMEVIQRELFAYYEALIRGDTGFELPAPPIQYKDYAAWQRSFLTEETLSGQLLYWKEKLSGYSPLSMPTDFPRPKKLGYAGHRLPFAFDAGLSSRLRALSRKEGITLHSLLLTAFNILLSKYSNQRDIVTGSAIANRQYRQTQDVVGFFVNMQVNRVTLRRDQRFTELAALVHRHQVMAQSYQDLPFEKLVQELNIERDASQHPLFQVTFSVQSFGKRNEASKALERYLLPVQQPTAYAVGKFDLSVFIDDSSDAIGGYIEYASALFRQNTIEAFTRHFGHLLEQIVAEPDRIYSGYSLLTDQQRNELVISWNQTQMEYPETRTIHSLFEEQVPKYGNSAAIFYEGGQLTYHQLNQKSNQLARLIRAEYKKHSGTEMSGAIVALFIDRSSEMIVAIMAVLKAGGAYLPLDLSYPKERIDYMLADSGAALILTKRGLVDAAREKNLDTERMVFTDLTESCYDTEDVTPLPPASAANDLAYLIYTSGTTGKPKGVMVEHRSVINLITNEIMAFGANPNERVLQYASYVFDASVWEIFFSLVSGRQIFIAPEDIRRDAEGLVAYLDRHCIEWATLPPAILTYMPHRPLRHLKTLIVAGEPLSGELMDLWSEGRVFINAYGPTESTVCASMHRYRRGDLNTNIGKPLKNARLYVLDRDLSPVPVGCVGELYIGGAVLARGYLHNEALTAESFVANPFASANATDPADSRLYKTGDLVRWSSDGELEYIGRYDHQIKIRGHRIELAEIEQALCRIPGIRNACVTTKKNPHSPESEKYLVAYYIPDGGHPDNNDREILDNWENLYESSYSHAADAGAAEADFSGWKSFITGKDFPFEEMEAWRNEILQKIARLKPSSVLEIGVGSGLIMYPLVGEVDRYTAIDISGAVIARHRDYLKNRPYPVDLHHLHAHQMETLPAGTSDTIILNSVCQYFPGIHYFNLVLEMAFHRLTPNGSIFLGDLRNFDLQNELIGEKLAYAGKEPLPAEVSRLAGKENEFLISPQYFLNLAGEYSNIRVEILDRKGSYDNELSRYRFDVVLSAVNGRIERSRPGKTPNSGRPLYNTPYLNQLSKEAIADRLSKLLPEFMIPAAWVPMPVFPLTINGKIDKRALPDVIPDTKEAGVAPTTRLQNLLCRIYSDILHIPLAEVDIHQSFFQMGGNSILSVRLKNRLSQVDEFKQIGVADLFKYDTIQKLMMSIEVDKDEIRRRQENPGWSARQEIAVIGVSGAFSGVNTIAELWELLIDQREGTHFHSREECSELKVDEALVQHPRFIAVTGKVEGIELFDPFFWDLPPADATLLNPQIRKFVEHCWFALEAAGYSNKRKDYSIGVFAGSGESDYLYEHILGNESTENVSRWEATIANTKDAIATKTAFLLDLSGPANSINTACSTGLVTVVEACKNLSLGTCDLALAGGSSLAMPYDAGYVHQDGLILSGDGHCRTFDKDASGSVRGSGVAVVLLKRLEDAVRDQDEILGVIKGYATNNDGSRKTGYTAPSVIGQSECIVNAQTKAGVTANEIDYVECHGTGTNLGDPIEVQALAEAFAFNRNGGKNEPSRQTILGAIKPNIGHTDTAAGTAGLIKVCQMLRYGLIPAQVNYTEPNPELKLAENNFEVLREHRSWPASPMKQRLAGVSSFGIGGTNAHIIVGDHLPALPPASHETGANREERFIVPLSAKSRQSLERYKHSFIEYLERRRRTGTLAGIREIAFTLDKNRVHHPYRSAYAVENIEELIDQLRKDASFQKANTMPGKLVFLFPGQGAQYVNMARELYQNEKQFQSLVDECIAIANNYLGADLKEVLFPKGVPVHDISEIRFSAVSLFTLGYSLAKYLEASGITADGYLGHSFGEYVAATLAGVFTLHDGIRTVVARGAAMQAMEEGRMLAINAGIEVIRPMAEKFDCEIAVVNSVDDVVVSGTAAAIDQLYAELEGLAISAVKVKGSVAGHSRLMDGAAETFRSAFDAIRLNPPSKVFISNVTGEIAGDEVATPGYWCKQLRQPVQFAKGIDSLCSHLGQAICFVELGPGKGLSYFVQKYKSHQRQHELSTLPLIPSGKEKESNSGAGIGNREELMAKCWMAGVLERPNAPGLFSGARNLSDLPSYQFNHQVWWIDRKDKLKSKPMHPVEEIFYERSWERLRISSPDQQDLPNKNILLIFSEERPGATIEARMRDALGKITAQSDYIVHRGANSIDESRAFDLCDTGDLRLLLGKKAARSPIDAIVYVSSSTDPECPELDILAIRNIFDWSGSVPLKVKKFISVSFDNFEVIGTETLHPQPSVVSGVTRSIPVEYFLAETSVVHLDLTLADTDHTSAITAALQNADRQTELIAVRGSYYWKPTYLRVTPDQEPFHPDRSPSGGKVYLITGGLGDLAFSYATDLIRYQDNCTLILIARKPETQLGEDQKNRLEALRARCGRVIYLPIDLGDSGCAGWLGKQLRQENIPAIDVAFHAAVVYAKSISGTKTADDLREVLVPKVSGTHALIELSKEIPIDTLVNCSSLGSILPSTGNMEYVAANTYLDEIALRHYPTIRRILTININQLSDSRITQRLASEQTSKMNASSDAITLNELVGIIEKLLLRGVKGGIALSRYDINQQVAEWRIKPSLTRAGSLSVADKKVLILDEEYTDTEYRLAQVYGSVLGVGEISTQDDFLKAGGNSILAIQLVSAIRRSFGVELSVKEIFSQSSICRLSRVLEQSNSGPERTIPAGTGRSTGMYEAVKLQMWRYQTYKQGSPGNINASIRKDFTNLNKKALVQALDALIERHESLRTLFYEKDDRVFLKIVPASHFEQPLVFEDIREEADEDNFTETVFIEMHKRMFDFQTEPCFICRLLSGKQKQVFLMVLDHMIYDAHSLQILENEFMQLYHAFSRGASNPLKPLNVQFKEYAQWHNSHYQGEKLAMHEEYFTRFYKNAPRKPRFRLGQSLPGLSAGEGGVYVFHIDQVLMEEIHAAASDLKVSFFNYLLAAYTTFLNKVSDSDDFIIDTPTSTRNSDDLAKIVGWVVGCLITRVKIDPEVTFKELVLSCRDGIMEGMDHVCFQDFHEYLELPWFEHVTQLNILDDKGTGSTIIADFTPKYYDVPSLYFDLAFNVRVHKNGIWFACQYKYAAVGRSEIREFCDDFIKLIRLAVQSPEINIRVLQQNGEETMKVV